MEGLLLNLDLARRIVIGQVNDAVQSHFHLFSGVLGDAGSFVPPGWYYSFMEIGETPGQDDCGERLRPTRIADPYV